MVRGLIPGASPTNEPEEPRMKDSNRLTLVVVTGLPGGLGFVVLWVNGLLVSDRIHQRVCSDVLVHCLGVWGGVFGG